MLGAGSGPDLVAVQPVTPVTVTAIAPMTHGCAPTPQCVQAFLNQWEQVMIIQRRSCKLGDMTTGNGQG
ncbi:hypothetical protein AFE_2334 [Acidithiobacillus ferrooxidans ATCC 23270]|uniref:Uncharacterized protein n=1 Tax=Acidithiobacillus ferrooxidans (strain ATCC 23270 / DSM 14882 / CIP 104768 / NCIMB 8455) TaxID=243159 RepID=B7J6A2_ACIF2|nr:hypothetical protein AFE_2334 [Acidithiobacillus ferrooxidans ATCC 23270]